MVKYYNLARYICIYQYMFPRVFSQLKRCVSSCCFSIRQIGLEVPKTFLLVSLVSRYDLRSMILTLCVSSRISSFQSKHI